MDSAELDINQVWDVPHQSSYGQMIGMMRGMDSLVTYPSCTEKLTMVESRADSMVKPGPSLQMCSVRRRWWLAGRFQRRLINESMDTFLSVQKAAEGFYGVTGTAALRLDKDFRAVLIKKSKEYRSIMQACVSEITSYLEAVDAGRSVPFKEDVETLQSECQVLYKMELILGLAEIVFLSTPPGGMVVCQLLTWSRLHFPQCRHRLAEALSSDQPHTYALYWETVYGLVLQGMKDEARDLLSRHSASNSDAFLSADEILRKMPLYTTYTGISEAEFLARWHHWQSECQARLYKDDFATCKQLETVCKILCGDMETLQSLCDVAETWYSLLPALLLYTRPTARLHRLPTAARDALFAFGADDDERPPSALDRLLLAVLEDDHRLLMKECHGMLGNLWFSAHLCDLLCHALTGGPDADKKFLLDLRETLLTDYSCALASHPSLWQVGLVYVDWIAPLGAAPLLGLILERLPLTSHHKASKVVQAAAQRGLDHVAVGVCRVMGRRLLREGQLEAAIWWGLHSQDAAFTAHLAHKILSEYAKDGRFLSSSLLDHLGPAMFVSDTLIFLGKYREFHVLYGAGKEQAAASLLASIVASRLAPEYFWPVLLEDATPLLEADPPVFSADQTFTLMASLDLVTLNAGDSEATRERKRRLYGSFLSKEAPLRQALTQNLARAIVHEGTASNVRAIPC